MNAQLAVLRSHLLNVARLERDAFGYIKPETREGLYQLGYSPSEVEAFLVTVSDARVH